MNQNYTCTLHERLKKALSLAQKKMLEVKDNMHAYENWMHSHLKVEISPHKSPLPEAHFKARLLKADLEANTAAYRIIPNAKIAQKRAEHAEEYAMACLELLYATMHEADMAIAEAIFTAYRAQDID